MQDVQSSVDKSYDSLDAEEWKAAIEDVAEEHGAFQDLGDDHFAAFVEAGRTLLVTFETAEDLRDAPAPSRPLGHEFILSQGWSHLGLFSETLSWFRDERIYGYFDRLIDDGFFEDFDRVLFYGTGAAGYAAAAFSVAAPGATVLLLNPHATMDPRLTEWDPRFPEARRLKFTDRFGYAPDMMDAADQGFVLYDPQEDMDAMHSALFERPNTTRLRVPFMGDALDSALSEMGLLMPLIEAAGNGTLDANSFARLYRGRRENLEYMRLLLANLDARGHLALSHLLCRRVLDTFEGTRHFRRRFRHLKKLAADGKFTPLNG